MTVQSAVRSTTLHPGDVELGMRGDRLHTLLGSCVAIVLTDPRRTVGVMCHVVYPPPSTGAPGSSCAYGDQALACMVSLLQSCGIDASQCDAYVFGGGNMFPHMVTPSLVGDGNVTWAMEALATLGARVLSVDVGGPVYRQLHWTVGPQPPQTVAIPL